MKLIFAILALATAGLAVSAQEPKVSPKPAETPVAVVSKIQEPTAICDLTVPNSPRVFGLQLRMPEPEASLYIHTPFEKDPADPEHLKRATVKFDKDPFFENVESATLTSVDGKISSIRLTFNVKRASAKEFVMEYGPKLGVVRSAFRIDTERNEAKIRCKDFTIELNAGDTGSGLFITEIRPEPNHE